MERREVLRAGLGLVGLAGLARWDALGALVGSAGAQTPGCILLPQQAAGPFYFDTKQIRRDITEGRPGAVLELGLQVVDAATCAPVAGALVDVWHADVRGVYSGYEGQGADGDIDARGEDFMRGIQVSDEEGRVEFATVYPGWYPGRPPHIHLKVYLDESTAITSQLYFPDALSRAVYAQGVYGGLTDTITSGASQPAALQLAVAAQGEGYRATHRIGIAGGATHVAPAAWGWLKDARR